MELMIFPRLKVPTQRFCVQKSQLFQRCLTVASTQSKVYNLLLSSALLVQYSAPCLAAGAQSDATVQNRLPVDSVVSPDQIPPTEAIGSAQIPPTEALGPEQAPIDIFGSSHLLLAAAQPAALNSSDSILQGGVTSDPAEAGRQVDDLTRQILLKLIEFERFNLHYTLEVAKQGRWKGWRYAFFQEINATTGLAGSIVSTAERGSHLKRPTKVSRITQEDANLVAAIGSCIGAGAAIMEFGINEYHDVIARSKGFAPKTARLHITALKADINRLMAARETLLRVEASSSSLQARADIDEAEGKVLNDLRDEALMEFERFQIGGRKLFAFQQSQLFFDATKYSLNAAGAFLAYDSLHARDRRYNGRAGVCWNISGGVYMFGPIISRVLAKEVAAGHKRALRKTVGDAHQTTIDKLEADRALLANLCKNTAIAPDKVETAVNRSAMYDIHEKSFADEILAGQKAKGKAVTVASQNIGAGMYLGASRLSQGILFTIPGFNRAFNSKSVRASTVTNNDLFAAAVIGIPAGAFSILDTMRIQVQGELNRHKLKKAGLLPGQIAHARLKQLDDMETRLAATK
ncbi:hypothetical protein BH10CYA1_BH10CYA1_36030 [soil metagenome]